MNYKKNIIAYSLLLMSILVESGINHLLNAKEFVIKPYLRNMTPTSVMISWELPEQEDGVLYYGKSPGKYEHSITLNPGRIHRITINGLKPNTMYYYRVKTGSCETPEGDPCYYFKTGFFKPRSFTLAVYGDISSGLYSYDTNHQRVLSSIINYSFPEFVIITGDIVYNGKLKSDWVRFFQNESELLRSVPVYATLGNNDQKGKDYFYDYFVSPRKNPWYSFNWGGCHFIALDIMRGMGNTYYRSLRPGNPQFAWLLKDLQSEDNLNAKFTFVFFHAPIFSPDGRGNRILEQMLHPIFLKYGVDMVFNGTHSYTRAEKDGIVYIISGGAGAEINRIKEKKTAEIKETGYIHHHLRVNVNYPVIEVNAVDTQGSVFSSLNYWAPEAKGRKKDFQTVESMRFDIPAASPDRVPLTIFSLPGCGYCMNLMKKTIPVISRRLKIELPIIYYPLDKAENFEKLVYAEQVLNNRDNELPVVIIEDRILGGKKEIKESLIELITSLSQKKDGRTAVTKDRGTTTANAKKIILDKFNSLGILPVLLAGLLDGINPCAFTTIIFLLTYLLYIGKSRKEAMIAGACFSVGVFLTYTTIGLGFSEIVTSISLYTTIYTTISLIMKYVILSVVIILGILSLYDFYLCLKGKLTDIKLQLPQFFKRKISKIIWTQTKKPKLIVSSLVLGALVSLFELPCTGQVYLPTILYAVKITGQRLKAISYIVAYNFMFIIPLIFVFVMSYYGLSESVLVKLFRKNMALTKLFTAMLFFGLAGFILIF